MPFQSCQRSRCLDTCYSFALNDRCQMPQEFLADPGNVNSFFCPFGIQSIIIETCKPSTPSINQPTHGNRTSNWLVLSPMSPCFLLVIYRTSFHEIITHLSIFIMDIPTEIQQNDGFPKSCFFKHRRVSSQDKSPRDTSRDDPWEFSSQGQIILPYWDKM